RRSEAGGGAPREGRLGRNRRAELLRPEARTKGDGHTADGDAAFGDECQVAAPAKRGRRRALSAARVERAMAESDVLEIENLTKRFGDLVAVDDASLSVREGEIHALVGENGAGKTTLMNVIYGLLPRDAGSIRLRGRTVDFGGPAEAIAAGIGMVHQHFKLAP